MIDIRKLTEAEYDTLTQALYEYVDNMEAYEHNSDGQITERERLRLVTATRLRDELDAVHQALADADRRRRAAKPK